MTANFVILSYFLVILSVSEVSTFRSFRSRLSLNLALNLKCELHL